MPQLSHHRSRREYPEAGYVLRGWSKGAAQDTLGICRTSSGGAGRVRHALMYQCAVHQRHVACTCCSVDCCLYVCSLFCAVLCVNSPTCNFKNRTLKVKVEDKENGNLDADQNMYDARFGLFCRHFFHDAIENGEVTFDTTAYPTQVRIRFDPCYKEHVLSDQAVQRSVLLYPDSAENRRLLGSVRVRWKKEKACGLPNSSSISIVSCLHRGK